MGLKSRTINWRYIPLENAFINLSGFFQSGSPYTKLKLDGRPVGEINSERGPSYWRADLRFQKAFMLRDYFGEGAGKTSIEFFVDINNIFNRTAIAGFYTRTGDPDDDGDSFSRSATFLGTAAYYKEADFGIAETFTSEQYDYLGNRLYSENADHDKNGIVTQAERYQSYVNYLKLLLHLEVCIKHQELYISVLCSDSNYIILIFKEFKRLK